jgi:DnaJ-domain-containing protein 1
MNSSSYTLGEVFSHYIITQQPTAVREKVAEFLKEGDFSKPALSQILRGLGGNLSSFKADLVELLFFFIEFCLRDHHLSAEEKLSIRHLKILFAIKERELYSLKKEEISNLLSLEMKRLLRDQLIDDDEAVYQVDLQEVFGLSYDQFLFVTRPPVQEIVDRWIHKIAADGNVSEEERDLLYRQILTLDRLYEFTASQRKVLENKGRFGADASEPEDERKPDSNAELDWARALLGVNIEASLDDVRTAYRRMARLNHPDKVAQMSDEMRQMAEARMKDINAAYAELQQIVAG